ncbi:hypothetical protein DdX_11420 [Ditylenchus destructor]|uniref:Uncharacterized protein n=1 Tax=Ditylenchus destructor TaxID=166010 RepID=A0AAD4N0W6_9BILA|nr:hypothetical protein DdX_11420 [Ditylenchus destructor]
MDSPLNGLAARNGLAAAAKQARQSLRQQQGGMPNLQLVRQARPQLRRQESALDLVPCFNPLYPQEEPSTGRWNDGLEDGIDDGMDVAAGWKPAGPGNRQIGTHPGGNGRIR